MNQKRNGIQPTTKEKQEEYIEADFRPPIDEEAEVELFIGARPTLRNIDELTKK
jgi:hypothetical protein